MRRCGDCAEDHVRAMEALNDRGGGRARDEEVEGGDVDETGASSAGREVRRSRGGGG